MAAAVLGSALGAYSAVDPSFLPAVNPNTWAAAASAEPGRRSLRLEDDMTPLFERLSKLGKDLARTASSKSPGAGATGGVAEELSDEAGADAVVATPDSGSPATSRPAPPMLVAAPAPGMPLSLTPAQRSAANDQPRAMDPRLSRMLDQLGGGAATAALAALPQPDVVSAGATQAGLIPADASLALPLAPAMAQTPDFAPPVAPIVAANQAAMTAEELNAQEHRRIRLRALENAAGGIN